MPSKDSGTSPSSKPVNDPGAVYIWFMFLPSACKFVFRLGDHVAELFSSHNALGAGFVHELGSRGTQLGGHACGVPNASVNAYRLVCAAEDGVTYGFALGGQTVEDNG